MLFRSLLKFQRLSNYLCFQWGFYSITSKIPKEQGSFSFNLPTSFTTAYQFVCQRTSRLTNIHVTALNISTTQVEIGTYNTGSASDIDCNVRIIATGNKT